MAALTTPVAQRAIGSSFPSPVAGTSSSPRPRATTLVWGLPYKLQNAFNSPSRRSTELAALRRGGDHVGPAPGSTNHRQTDVSAQATTVTSPTAVQQQLQQAMEPAQAGAAPPARTHLECVRISDFALVDDATIAFDPTFVAITGESGSGKSVLMEALGQLMGASAPPECVRHQADMAVVEGWFVLDAATAARVRSVLAAEGVPRKALPQEGGGPCRMHIRREILRGPAGGPGAGGGSSAPGGSSDSDAGAVGAGGAAAGAPHESVAIAAASRPRSRCFINRSPVTLRSLRALSGLLLDMNGQHSSEALRDSDTQLALLDRVAGTGALAAKTSATLAQMGDLEERLESFDTLSDPEERNSLRKLVEAVSKANLVSGEEVELRKAVRAMDAKRAIAEQCATAHASLMGDSSGGGVAASLKSVENQIRGIAAKEGQMSTQQQPSVGRRFMSAAATRAQQRSTSTPPPGALSMQGPAPGRAGTPPFGHSQQGQTGSSHNKPVPGRAGTPPLSQASQQGHTQQGPTQNQGQGQNQQGGFSNNIVGAGTLHQSLAKQLVAQQGAAEQQIGVTMGTAAETAAASLKAAQEAAAAAVPTGSGGSGSGSDDDAHRLAVQSSNRTTEAGAGSGSSHGNGDAASSNETGRSAAPARAGSVAASSQHVAQDGAETQGAGQQAEEEEEEDEEEAGLLEQALAALEAARQQLAAADAHVRNYSRTTAFSPAEYKAKSDRLAMVERLLRVHRCRSTVELLAAAERAEEQLAQYEEMAEHAEDWECELDRLRCLALQQCVELSAARRAAAPLLARHVESSLSELAMGGARFSVTLTWQPEPQAGVLRECEALDVPPEMAALAGQDGGKAYRVRTGGAGLDVLELQLAAGPAEPFRPLAAVASGGESARLMLALKAAPSCASASGAESNGTASSSSGNGITSGKSGIVFLDGAAVGDPRESEAEAAAAAAAEGAAVGPAIMILDEIDSGIGSRLGAPIGIMLRRMAGLPAPPTAGSNSHNSSSSGMPSSQIICVTHLAQVACHAEQHIRVSKANNGAAGGRVTTRFQPLESDEDRITEVAAMMGMGKEVATNVLAAARQNGSGSGAAGAGDDVISQDTNPYLP